MTGTDDAVIVRLMLASDQVRAEDGQLLVGDMSIAQARPEVLERLVELLREGASEDDLLDSFLDEPPAVAASVLHVLHLAERAGAIAYELVVADAGTGLVRIEAQRAPLAALSTQTADYPGFSSLPSSWVEPSDGQWVLLDPRSPYAARFSGRALDVLATLPCDDVDDPRDRSVLTMLARAGLVAGAPSVTPSYWDPHDLRFHWRTRKGRHQRAIGATFPRRGHLPVRDVVEAPALAGRQVGPFVAPYVLRGEVGEASTPYGRLLQQRGSTRRSVEPLSEESLGSFLNAHGLSLLLPQDDAAGIEYPQSRRPYPGGGAMYEIDLNVSILETIGSITPGVWWWNPQDLSLHLRSDDVDLVERLFADARVSTGGDGEPRALITYTARIGRNSWKYDGMAYRLALMDVGVLYHHAYLVAADLGIGVCGLGNGDALLFDRGLGLDIERETSIAELILVGPR